MIGCDKVIHILRALIMIIYRINTDDDDNNNVAMIDASK